MYLFREGITLAEAMQRLETIHVLPRTIKVPVIDAMDRYLAENIVAEFDLPSFRRSGYDGYALCRPVKPSDTTEFTVVGEVPAGSAYQKPLKENETVRIMTGGAVPDSADIVIMLEQTEEISPGRIRILSWPKKDNIMPIGVEYRKGDLLLEKGTRLNPGAISLLCAFGITDCLVYEPPKAAVITTGSELQSTGSVPVYGKIYDSNGPLLRQLLLQAGAEADLLPAVADDLPKLKSAVKVACKNYDFVLTSGGVSVGDFDFMAVLAQESGHCLFNKLKMRPGSPTTAFICDGTPVLALSGNPGACFTGFYFFAEPLVRKFMEQATALKTIRLPIAEDYRHKNKFDRYLRGDFVLKDGRLLVKKAGSDQSSALGNLAQTRNLIKVPHDMELMKGQEVEVWVLPSK